MRNGYRFKKITYEISLLKRGRPCSFYGTLSGGLFDKEFILHTRSDFVERLGLCDRCYGRITHVIIDDVEPGGYTNKFCPVLFHDLIKPSWKLQDVNGFRENMYLSKRLSKGPFQKRPLSGVWED
jgi:hypothetical protein